MAASLNQDFVTYKGDSVTPIFTVLNSAGTAIDISSVTQITWTARRENSDSATVTKTKTGGTITFVTDGTDGKFQVAIIGTDTTAMDGFYLHEASITDASGNVTTVSVGRMNVGVAPTWTYDPGSISTNRLYMVRRLVGDVLQNDQQLQDEEVNAAIAIFSNNYLAAAECCRWIAAQYSRLVDTVQGQLSTNYSAKQRAYAQRALELQNFGMSRGAGAMPFAGGITTTDKAAQVSDTSRVTPQFNIGMGDNLLLGNGAGNETPANPGGGNA